MLKTIYLVRIFFLFCLVTLSTCTEEPIVDDRWDVLPGTNGAIYSMVNYGDMVIYGGNFTSGENADIKYLALFDVETGVTNKLINDIVSVGNASTHGIHTLALSEENLYLGGNFVSINEISSFQNLAELNLSSKAVSSIENGIWFYSPNSVPVSVVQVFANEVIVGGNFDTYCKYLQLYRNDQWNCLLLQDEPSPTQATIPALFRNDQDLYISSPWRFSKTNLTTSINETIAVTDGTIECMLLLGDELYIGGFFSKINGVTSNGLAVYNINSGEIKTFPLQVIDWGFHIQAMAVFNKTIFVAANFDKTAIGIGGGIAAFNIITGKWETLGSGTIGEVNSLLVNGNYLYVGGSFIEAGGKPATGFARYKLQ